MKSDGKIECGLCGRTIPEGQEFDNINICAKFYHICDTCDRKLYYHYSQLIIEKIKHP